MAASFFDVVGTRTLRFWNPPAEDFLPTVVPIGDCLTRSDHACVAIESATCWPDGITLTVAVVLREELATGKSLLPVVRHPIHREEVGETDLLFGVVFADGTATTNVDRLEHDRRLTSGPTLDPGTTQTGKRTLRQQVQPAACDRGSSRLAPGWPPVPVRNAAKISSGTKTEWPGSKQRLANLLS